MFKTYDRVLMRRAVSKMWVPTFFGRKVSEPAGVYYEDVSGFIYSKCIPYEGNEYLAYTTNDNGVVLDGASVEIFSDNYWIPCIYIGYIDGLYYGVVRRLEGGYSFVKGNKMLVKCNVKGNKIVRKK